MKTLLGVVTVYCDKDSRTGSATFHDPKTNKWEITLTPQADGVTGHKQVDFGTVLAHELGHFVSKVTQHDAVPASALGKTAEDQLHDERMAFQYAGIIDPAMHRDEAQAALNTYIKFAAEAKRNGMDNTPLNVLGMLGIIDRH